MSKIKNFKISLKFDTQFSQKDKILVLLVISHDFVELLHYIFDKVSKSPSPINENMKSRLLMFVGDTDQLVT